MEKELLQTRVPFAFARSALFRPGNALTWMHEQSIQAATDYRIDIEYEGPALTQSHALVWQALVAFACSRPEGTSTVLEVPTTGLLRACGRKSMQTHARKWVRSVVADLLLAHVRIATPRQRFDGCLIAALSEPSPGLLRVHFDPGMEALLANEVVRVPLALKAGLSFHPLGSWLHDYVATHRDVYKVPLSTLHRLSGSVLEYQAFRPRLIQALDMVLPRRLALVRYERNGDLLTLHKKKTGVVLLRDGAEAAQHFNAKHHSAIQHARLQRIRVAL